MSSLAGVIAEKTFTGKRANHVGAADDYRSAVDLAMYACRSDAEATALLKWLHLRTEQIVKSRWQSYVVPVAEALLQRQTLSPRDIAAALEAAVAKETRSALCDLPWSAIPEGTAFSAVLPTD